MDIKRLLAKAKANKRTLDLYDITEILYQRGKEATDMIQIASLYDENYKVRFNEIKDKLRAKSWDKKITESFLEEQTYISQEWKDFIKERHNVQITASNWKKEENMWANLYKARMMADSRKNKVEEKV